MTISRRKTIFSQLLLSFALHTSCARGSSSSDRMLRSAKGSFAATTQGESASVCTTRFTDSSSGNNVSFARAMNLMAEDGATGAEWRALVSAVLQDAPFSAFFWEHPPVSQGSIEHKNYEFVLVDARNSFEGMRPEVEAFREHFRKGEAISTFENLGGDALLVAPVPMEGKSNKVYTHMASFVREADSDQVDQLFQSIGAGVQRRLGIEPLWLSTSGLGVAWLHVRMDSRPKYYQYIPYKRWQ